MNLAYEQIIKVLEHCISASDVDTIDDCKGCLLDEECGKDCDALMKTTLDFIKYQHKVINSATQEIVDLKIKVKEQKAEIERLKESRDKLYEEMTERQKEEVAIAKRMGKAETIKEFAERLKKSTFDCDVSLGYGNGCYVKAVTTIEIDNLVKEMVGDNNV